MVPANCTWPALLIAPNAEAPNRLLLEVPFWAIYGKTPISDSCRMRTPDPRPPVAPSLLAHILRSRSPCPDHSGTRPGFSRPRKRQWDHSRHRRTLPRQTVGDIRFEGIGGTRKKVRPP